LIFSFGFKRINLRIDPSPEDEIIWAQGKNALEGLPRNHQMIRNKYKHVDE
jgi:hypothetical protein